MKVTLLLAIACLVACVTALPVNTVDRSLIESSNSCSGTCSDIRTTTCGAPGGFISGKCPGSSNIRCCTGKVTTIASSSAAAAAAPAPVPASAPSSSGNRCTQARGECLHSGTNKCNGGAFRSGLCPGPAAIKCCVKGSSSSSSSSPAPAPAPLPSGRLPTFEKLRTCYPQGTADEVKKRIGGRVNAAWITNTCAIRMSETLNCAGSLVPQSGGESVTGGNRANYIFRVKQLAPLMRKLFGKGTTVKAPSGRGVPLSAFKGKKGIIMFDTTGAWSDATGHFDLWDGESMVEANHAGAAEAARYFGLSVSITLWEF